MSRKKRTKKSNVVRNVLLGLAFGLLLVAASSGITWYLANPATVAPTSIVRTVIVVHTATPLPTPTATPKPRHISASGKLFIMFFEQRSLVAYYDIGGHCTIGIGHRMDSMWCDGELKASEAQIDAWFEEDIKQTEHTMAIELGGVELNQCQYDALASFTFNLGDYYLRVSGFRDKLLNNDYVGVLDIFAKYKFVKGVEVKGLVTRRAAEAKLFTECEYIQ